MHFACIMISPFLASVRAYNAWNSRETVTIRHVKFSVNTPDVEVYTRVAINFLILSEGDHASQAERRFLLLLLPFLSSLFFFFFFFYLFTFLSFFFFFFPSPVSILRDDATMHTSGVNPCQFSHGLCIAGTNVNESGARRRIAIFSYMRGPDNRG